ncbi:hypothetical protein MAR_006386, partial [Mya arenaria]
SAENDSAFGANEIENDHESSDETVLKFDLPVQRASLNQTEALGASLLLFVDRTLNIETNGQ